MSLSTAELAILVRVQDEASKALDKIDKSGGGVLNMFKAIVPAVIGFGAAFATWDVLDKAIEKTEKLADDVGKLTRETGLSTESASHVIAWAETVGVSYDTVRASLGTLSKNLKAANDENAETTEKSADKISDANKAMALTVKDAQQRMSDAYEDARFTVARAARDEKDAISDANRDFKRTTEDAKRALVDAHRDMQQAIKETARDARDAARDINDANRDVARTAKDNARDQVSAQKDVLSAQRDLAIAQKELKAGTVKDNESVVRAQERLKDAQERVKQVTEDSADRIVRANERVRDASERATETQERGSQRITGIRERETDITRKQGQAQQDYLSKIADIQQRFADTQMDTQRQLVRTIRDSQETIDHAGDKYSDKIDKLSDVDTKKFKKALSDLGLTMSDLTDDAGRLTESGMDKLADAFAKSPDATTKAAIAQAIFGKGGKDMIAILDKGSHGLLQMSKDADRLGVTLSADNVEKIGKYTEAHKKFGLALTGLQIAVAIQIMPELTKLADWFVKNQPQIREFVIETIEKAKTTFEEWKPTITDIVNGFIKWSDILIKHKKAIMDVAFVLGLMFVAANPLLILIPALVLGLAYLTDHWDEVTEAVGKAADSIKRTITDAINSVIAFVKTHWVLIVTLLTGPIGNAAIQIIKHWDDIKKAVSDFVNFIADAPGAVADAVSRIVGTIISYFESLPQKLYDIGKSAGKSLLKGLGDLPGVKQLIGAGNAIGGLHIPGLAGGTAYVSHDQLAILHRGETVRTAGQTRNDRGGSGSGMSVNFYGPVSMQGRNKKVAAATVGAAFKAEMRSRGYAA